MNYQDFNMAMDSFKDEAVDIIPFLAVSCNLSFDIATELINLHRNKNDKNKRIYMSLPAICKDHLNKFKNYELIVEIKFNYG